MRVTLIHNRYARLSGEDVMLSSIARTLRDHGHAVSLFIRDSSDIDRTSLGKIRAFFTGVHSFSAVRSLEEQLRREKPDVVNIQNVYPLISAGAFEAAGRLGIPIVFRCANYRMFCPSGLLLSHGRICERCVKGGQHWCALRNCEDSLAKSVGYSLRNAWTRMTGAITRNTTLYVVPSAFQREKFADWGIPRDRLAVIPNLVEPAELLLSAADTTGAYVGYAGRVSREKGVDVLLDAMRTLDGVPCRIAGDFHSMPHLAADPPAGVVFLGPLARDGMRAFYGASRMLVVPSLCYETFGLVIAEAMLQGRPVIGSRVGAIPEVIDDGRTGLLFEPGNAAELAEKIRFLWREPGLCREMGLAGRRKVLEDYNPELFYQRLIQTYEHAICLADRAKEVAA